MADERRSAAQPVFRKRGLRRVPPEDSCTPGVDTDVSRERARRAVEYIGKLWINPIQEGAFSTFLETSREGSTFSVTDGINTSSLPAVWAFGFKNGQTYVLEKDGAYFESRLSFFTRTHSLDITPGHAPEVPKDLEGALGRKMDMNRAKACFRCHTTAAVTSKVFESEKSTPGVTCEACHGPGAVHVASMTANDPKQGEEKIMDPADLSPSDSVDFAAPAIVRGRT